MKRAVAIALLLSLVTCSVIEAENIYTLGKPKDEIPSLTLEDCYKLALVQSETIGIDSELIKQAEAHFLQALGVLLPHVTFMSSDTRQKSVSSGGISSSGFSTSTLSPSTSSLRNFNFTQNLFLGFKELAAMRGSKTERGQREYEKRRAELLLLTDVSDAFYLLMEERADLMVIKKIEHALVDRIAQLRQREALGRSRRSEVVNVNTQLYRLKAIRESVKNQEVVARQLLEFLVGQPVGRIVDSDYTFEQAQPKSYYLEKADRRSDVKAVKEAWEITKDGIIIANSGFLPTVSLGANYYTQRTGFLKPIDWDVTLQVNVPIFEGTETMGQFNEAISKERAAKLQYRHSRRNARLDIRDAYVIFISAIDIYKAYKKAKDAAQLNYYMQKEDYLLSLVSNLDVLTAIQDLGNSERDYTHALYESKSAHWRLIVAAEVELPFKEKI